MCEMPKYKIARHVGEDREVEADFYEDVPPFTDFIRNDAQRSVVLRVRQDDVSEIELIE
jgi:hypothetical protein